MLAGEPMSAIRRAVGEIADNLAYIHQHLPEVEVEDNLRDQIQSTCQAFDNDLYDVRSEIGNLSESRDASTAGLINKILHSHTEAMHALVTRLYELADRDVKYAGASVLVGESAANILRAYIEIRNNLPRISG